MATNLIIDTRDLDDLNACIRTMLELGPVSVQLKSHTKRSLSQNSLMWVKLTELSRTKKWHGVRLSPTNWKHLITASMESKRVVPNINNDGFVVLGKSTSSMSVADMAWVIDMADYLLAELD